VGNRFLFAWTAHRKFTKFLHHRVQRLLSWQLSSVHGCVMPFIFTFVLLYHEITSHLQIR
jgi:hypothetical protein